MPAVDDVGGKAHIDRAVFDFFEARADECEVLGVVHFAAEHGAHICGQQRDLVQNLVQGILCIAFGVPAFTECGDAVHPYRPVFFCQVVEGLGGDGIRKELDADFPDVSILYDRLKILLRQLADAADGNAAPAGCKQYVEHAVLQHEVAVHEEDVGV